MKKKIFIVHPNSLDLCLTHNTQFKKKSHENLRKNTNDLVVIMLFENYAHAEVMKKQRLHYSVVASSSLLLVGTFFMS